MKRKKFQGIVMTAVMMAASMMSSAETVYVTDSVSVGLFPSDSLSGEPLKRLLSGTAVEMLESNEGVARIKTAEGEEGWLRSTFLTSAVPAIVKLEQAVQERDKLKTELDAAKKQLSDLAQDSGDAKDIGRLRAELEKAQQKTEGLEKQLKALKGSKSEPQQETIARLKAENEDLLMRLSASDMINGIEYEAEDGAATAKVSLKWALVGLIVFLLAGIAAGYYIYNWRLRKRFGGVRII